MTALPQTPAELLRLSARLQLGNGAEVSGLGGVSGMSDVEWDCLLAIAAAHGMRPLLYRFLSGANGFIAIPDRVTLKLQEFTRQNLRKNLRMTGELILCSGCLPTRE